jgi:hypothetical protein
MEREIVQVSAGHLESMIRYEMELFRNSLTVQGLCGRRVPINLELHIKEYRQYLDPQVVNELTMYTNSAISHLDPTHDDYLLKTWVQIKKLLEEESDRVRHEIPRDP